MTQYLHLIDHNSLHKINGRLFSQNLRYLNFTVHHQYLDTVMICLSKTIHFQIVYKNNITKKSTYFYHVSHYFTSNGVCSPNKATHRSFGSTLYPLLNFTMQYRKMKLLQACNCLAFACRIPVNTFTSGSRS